MDLCLQSCVLWLCCAQPEELLWLLQFHIDQSISWDASIYWHRILWNSEFLVSVIYIYIYIYIYIWHKLYIVRNASVRAWSWVRYLVIAAWNWYLSKPLLSELLRTTYKTNIGYNNRPKLQIRATNLSPCLSTTPWQPIGGVDIKPCAILTSE